MRDEKWGRQCTGAFCATLISRGRIAPVEEPLGPQSGRHMGHLGRCFTSYRLGTGDLMACVKAPMGHNILLVRP